MKRILSMLLVVCMVLTPLPSAAAGNTVVVSDSSSLKSALTSSASGTIVQLDRDISFAETITVPSNLTLDLNNQTLTFTGTDPEKKVLIVGILFNGSGTFTVKDSGTNGKMVTSQTYSVALRNAGSGIMELTDGRIATTAVIASAIINSGSGTLKISGATVESEKYFAIINQWTSGKLNMSSGTVSSDSGYAIENRGVAEISGGMVSSISSIGISNAGSGSLLTVSGGTVKSISGYAIANSGNGNTVKVTGGTVSSEASAAIANFNSCELSGGTVSSDTGMAVANVGGNLLISNGATVNSNSGTTVYTNDNLTISGGTVKSVSGVVLFSDAPVGKVVTVSGGTLSSTSGYCGVNNAGGSMTISGTAVLSTTSGSVSLINQGTGTATINGGTMTAAMAELYNSNTGKIEINAGTYALAVNSNASGSIVINGGSVKAVQGATPKNSAGTPLSSYGITLTNGTTPIAGKTPIAAGELILTPTISYGFNGVKTDNNGTIYLWLPATVATANYKSGSIDVSGSITAGKTSILPNYSARVTVKLNGETWTNPFKVFLLTSNTSFWGADTVLSDGNAAKDGGVYEFSGLKPGQNYYIWGNGTLGGLIYSGVQLTDSAPNATVNFYNLNVTAGNGIDGVFMNATMIQGANAYIQANVKPGYIFEKWANTMDGAGVLNTPSGNITMDGKKDLTAYATLNTYDGSVTLNKDGSVWSSSGKTVTLSTSNTNVAGEGYRAISTDAGGVYSFTALSPLVTYYVWMDGNYTGQTVTTTDKNVVLDYYTVTLMTSGTNITAVSGAGVYLKGTEIQVSATVQTGDYVFSRWQNTTGGAMVSTANPYTLTVNSAISLTAVGGATKYSATVTLKKDGVDWTTSPRNIVLSTTSTALEGTVTGTASGNTYTFANLPGTGTYYVWDAETVTYTGKQITSNVKNAELEYFTVTVNPGSNITSVMGAGTYLTGSSITVTATPADYYLITGTGWVNGKYTISNISGAQIISPAADLDTYTGTINVKKDNVVWTDTTATIVLSTSSTDREAGKLTTAGVSGVFTAATLDPTKTYYVWADGVYTGQTVTATVKTAIVDYFTISVTKTNVDVSGEGTFLKGSNVGMTASNIADGCDFIGWKSGSTLLSTGMTFNVSNISSPQTLTAEASNMFEATVTLAGATGRDIKLSTSDTSLAGTVFGSGSGPCTFSGLTRGSTYYVYDGGTYTGKTVNKNAPNVTLQYYTVSLTKGTGIEAVFGGGTYLAGSTVSASASTATSYVFSGWSDGSAQNPYTITNLNSDKTLTANGALSFTGTVDITNGPILIENDDVNHGKIRIKQNGIILDGGDNLDPKTNIIITGTSSGGNGISVTATLGAYITLKDVTISGTTALKGCVDIADTAGNVTINLEGNNTLIGGSARAGIYKGMGSNTLTITGSGYLNATGGVDGFGQGAAGIGGAFISGAKNGGNIIITSGNVNATGDGNGAGIGGAQFGSSGNITISGGTIFANGDRGGAGIGGGTSGSSGSISITGGVITATSYQDPWGNSGAGIGGGYRSNSGSVTITGGTIIATSGGPGAGIGGGSGNYDSGVTPGSGGNVTIRGGTITATSNGGSGIGGGSKNSNGDGLVTTNTTITITGGNIKTSSMGNTPVGSNGKALTLETNAWIDTPTIVDNRGIAYGMNDVQAIEGQMYAYVDRNGYYTLTTPASATQNGVTATANIPSNSGLSSNNTITVTSSLSGTALKPGTYTVGLIGTGIGTVATQTLAVTMGQSVSTSRTFSFTMPASNVTDLALSFSFSESAKHTVSYYNDSMLLGSTAYYAGETYTLMNDNGLEKTGYTIGGWGVSGDQIMGTSDVTHTAVWIPNTYKVVFHNDNSTTEQSFTYNVETALNGSITKTGYTLSGWAETLNGPKVYNVNATVQNLTAVQNGTVNLYAVWQAQGYSVSFANGGGTGTMAQQSFIHVIAQELTPNTFTRTGYTFTGWTDGTTTYVNGQSITATGNISLTAQWGANSYRIVFNGNGANGGTTMANQSFSYDASQILKNNTLTRDGYTFGGWAMSSGEDTATYTNGQSVTNLTTMANGTITLYAIWTPNTYSVSFNANTGSGTLGNQEYTYDAAQTLTENAFTRMGYSFSGWNTLENGTGLNYANKASVINLAMNGSVTLYAQWTADTYSLAFNSSNGVGSMDNQNFATGDSGNVSYNRFVKPGYTFDGWSTGINATGTNYGAEAKLMSLDNLTATNPTLYAKWTANSYTVAFNANGAAGSIADQSFTYGVSGSLRANNFTRGLDTFLGWSTSSTAETATYDDEHSVTNLTTMANGKVTLYAVWRANTYEVRFDANGGSGDMLLQTIGRSGATLLNTNAYTRIGYSFAGWNTSINGSGLSYTNGQQVTNLPGDTANSITLYAQWTESARYNLNGTVKESGGTALSGATVKLMQGSTIVAQTMTGADGIYFFGNLKSGSYNVVATKDGKTITALVMISANTIQDMILPATAANNSILVVNSESNAEIPALVVGGLDKLASTGSADITMTITSKVENDGDSEQNAIKENAGSQIVGIYLDMIIKNGNDTLTNTANVLEIIIPFNLSGKTDINVYRYHGGTTMSLVKLTDKPGELIDGTFYLDSSNGLIHVYSSKFSTYAVTYTGVVSSGSGGGGKPGTLPNIENVVSGFPFVDVPETHWAREAIGWANENGLFSGTSPTIFSPGMSTSRGMVVAVLWRMEKNPLAIQDMRFTDVSTEAYYGKAVSWANENQVVLGYGNGLFGPNKTITREQMAAILYRFAMMKGNDVSKQAPLDNFVDGGKTAGYAQNAMEWAVANNLISGKKNNVLDPKGNATRAEVALILMRFSEL